VHNIGVEWWAIEIALVDRDFFWSLLRGDFGELDLQNAVLQISLNLVFLCGMSEDVWAERDNKHTFTP
jgi:hypothetical protein